MSKKLFIAVIALVILILAALGWRYFSAPAKAPTGDAPGTSSANLFPFGQGATKPAASASTATQAADSTSNSIDLSSLANQPKLRKLSSEPSMGGAFVLVGSTTLAVRFVDKATGHIVDAPVDGTAQTKVSNVTIPQVREVLWGDKASSLVYRYLKDGSTLQSFYASIRPSAASSSQPIEGLFLPANVSSMAVAGNKAFYFDPTADAGRLILANVDGSKKAVVWNSDFGEWAVSSNNPAKAFVYTKPSGTASGVGYIIDAAKGTATKVIGDVNGLEGTINPSGDYVFLSASENSAIASASYSVAKKAVSQLSVATLASKCAWSSKDKKAIYCAVPAGIQSGTYPDDWYKGVASFSDRLWKIDMDTLETTVVFDPFLDTPFAFDMTDLAVDPTDTYLTFVNKGDLTIWLLKIR